MSCAAKTPSIVLSSASSSAKYERTERLPTVPETGSASCHEARITTGTSSAISASITSEMPSAANVRLAPHCGIQV